MATSCLHEAVRLQLTAAIQADAFNTAEDILRCYKEQATLLFETERIKSALTADPFESLTDISSSIKRLQGLLRVTEYNSVTALDGYSRMEATVRFAADKTMRPAVQHHVQLKFLYERTACQSAKVVYAIDLSKDFGPAERMLWVNVVAVGHSPSPHPKNRDDASDGDRWSDMDDDNEDTPEDDTNGHDADETVHVDQTTGDEIDGDDSYVAGIDPDLLSQFMQWTKIGPMDDITALFLLMTFQFYELEWDIVGFILDAVFGSDDDNDESTGSADN